MNSWSTDVLHTSLVFNTVDLCTELFPSFSRLSRISGKVLHICEILGRDKETPSRPYPFRPPKLKTPVLTADNERDEQTFDLLLHCW